MKLLKLSMEERRERILNGSVLNTLIILSVPTLLMAVVQSMIPFTDGLFLNNIIGAKRVAAITFSAPAISIMLGMSVGLGIAAMAMIGQMAGKGDIEKVKEISLQVLIFSIFCGLVMIPISIIVAFYLKSTVTGVMQRDVFVYISLYSIVIPFQFLAAIFNAIKNSVGNPEAPFYRMVVLLIMKVAFNFLFLDLLRLDIPGAILASFCAYLITGLWMYYDLFIKEYLYKLNIKTYVFNMKIIKELIRIGIPSMLSYMMISLGFLLINMEIRKYGATALAGLGIAGYINNLSFQLPSSISVAVTTIISLNIGSGNEQKAKKAFKIGLIISFVISLFILVITLPFIGFYTHLFTREADVLKIADDALILYTFSIIPYGVFIICQSVLNALGRNNIPLVMSFLRIWLFRYVFILLTQKYLTYYSVFYGNLFSNVLAATIFLIIILKINWISGMEYGKE